MASLPALHQQPRRATHTEFATESAEGAVEAAETARWQAPTCDWQEPSRADAVPDRGRKREREGGRIRQHDPGAASSNTAPRRRIRLGGDVTPCANEPGAPPVARRGPGKREADASRAHGARFIWTPRFKTSAFQAEHRGQTPPRQAEHLSTGRAIRSRQTARRGQGPAAANVATAGSGQPGEGPPLDRERRGSRGRRRVRQTAGHRPPRRPAKRTRIQTGPAPGVGRTKPHHRSRIAPRPSRASATPGRGPLLGKDVAHPRAGRTTASEPTSSCSPRPNSGIETEARTPPKPHLRARTTNSVTRRTYRSERGREELTTRPMKTPQRPLHRRGISAKAACSRNAGGTCRGTSAQSPSGCHSEVRPACRGSEGHGGISRT